jgi:uncharacterized protein (DUF2267 family)
MTDHEPSTPVQPQDHEELNFIHQIRKELSLQSSQDAVRFVASILQALRQSFTLVEANAFLNLLPDFLKLAFAANWEQNETKVTVNHLDEFVTLVMDRDRKYRKGMFRSEVQTLSVIVLTLKKLEKLIDLQNFEGLSPSLRHELRGLPSEAAA